MIELLFRPMPAEPRYKALGRTSVRPTHTDSMNAIRYELSRLNATDVVIEAGFAENEIRQDGYPYSNAKPSHSTVRISFLRGGKTPMSMTCGGHGQWYFNVYLIAKTLEALRAVDRYGCTSGDEQYRGWSQLPPGREEAKPAACGAEWSSVESARRFIHGIAGINTLGSDEAAYRQAARKAHPDAGGSNDLMSKVNRARDFIESQAVPA